jgi:biopolymer transport protein ExbD
MAGIDTGGGHGRRPINQEIPLIPFIDFLLCLVSFLLITAVWAQMARINAHARLPGPETGPEPDTREKVLHVEMKGERNFTLVWKAGNTVVNTVDVERRAVPVGSASEFIYPDLAKMITEQWNENGSHRAATDLALDQAVLHTDNTTPFQDIIAVIDAIHTTKRELTLSGNTKNISAMNVSFAVN